MAEKPDVILQKYSNLKTQDLWTRTTRTVKNVTNIQKKED